ncbi:MAG: tetratricopeptide repeat protein [Methylobacter sp.]
MSKNVPTELFAELAQANAEKLKQAITVHRQGRLDQAETIYKEILSSQPRHYQVLQLLGTVAAQRNDLAGAVELFDRAIDIKPDYVQAHNNRGVVLCDLNLHEQALESCQLALKFKPDYIDAWYNHGNILLKLRRYEAAINSFEHVLKLKPGHIGAINNIGIALCDSAQYQRALEKYDQVLEIKSDHIDAWFNRSNALLKLKRYEEAIESFGHVLELNPGHVDAMNNIGIALYELGRYQQALDKYILVLKHKPGHIEAEYNRGNALLKLMRYDEAIDSYRHVLKLNPEHADSFNNIGIALYALRRLDDALQNYRHALDIQPDHAGAQFNSGLCHLQLGNFSEGWKRYEWRWKNNNIKDKPRSYAQPLWLGNERIQGKSILVYGEQGLGDILQFCRYVKLIADLGGKVILEARASLFRLLSGLQGVSQLIVEGDLLPAFDFHCPMLSLPLAFKTDLASIPYNVPYLFAEDERVIYWRKKLDDREFKIGINWQGNPMAAIDVGRSFALKYFYRLAQIPDVRLISLQKNEGTEQLQSMPEGMEVLVLGDDFDAGSDAFCDSAAVIKNLDLVITSDTAIAHLAGALGCPVWLLLKHVPDWRWMLDGEDSPWYPTMRIFRQKISDDWEAVFDEVANALIEMLKDRR